MNVFIRFLNNSRVILALLILTSSHVGATPFFMDNFENINGVNNGPSPVWTWRAPYSSGNEFGMMIGERDIYKVSDTVANSGRYALRINFNGRNNFCNTCGTESVTVSASNLSSGCFTTTGIRGDVAYNRDNSFSLWQVTSSSASEVCLNMNTAKEPSILDEVAAIELGDELKFPHVCGVNGKVGSNPKRRSDCDLAINYLEGIEKSDFDYGETLSRRMYVYIPADTVIPSVTIKLGYAKFEASTIVPFVSSSRGARFEIDGNGILGFVQTDLFFERNRWMYIEEVYTRETASNAKDGHFELYAGFAGDDLTTPVYSADKLTFGGLKSLSIVGNWPHLNDASGYMYIDDVMVSDQYVGPVNATVVAKPNPPRNVTAKPAVNSSNEVE